jgi:hypothetical protein
MSLWCHDFNVSVLAHSGQVTSCHSNKILIREFNIQNFRAYSVGYSESMYVMTLSDVHKRFSSYRPTKRSHFQWHYVTWWLNYWRLGCISTPPPPKPRICVYLCGLKKDEMFRVIESCIPPERPTRDFYRFADSVSSNMQRSWQADGYFSWLLFHG